MKCVAKGMVNPTLIYTRLNTIFTPQNLPAAYCRKAGTEGEPLVSALRIHFIDTNSVDSDHMHLSRWGANP